MPDATLSAAPMARSTPGAFAGGAVIGMLGGLIGLEGAEFRLPLLIGGTVMQQHGEAVDAHLRHQPEVDIRVEN